MPAYIDLHCHWIAGVDDGVRTIGEGIALLKALSQAGFSHIIATPHMRPGMFDNERRDLEHAYAQMLPHVMQAGLDVQLGLSCEHFFDDVVYGRIMSGQGLAYPGERAVLVEFAGDHLSSALLEGLFDIRRKGMRPVIAHPERYRACFGDLTLMEDWVDRGLVLLMDGGAMVGKYGRAPQKAAERMLEAGLYYAVCSDAHRPEDVAQVVAGLERIRALVGDEEFDFLLKEGPHRVLTGTVDLG